MTSKVYHVKSSLFHCGVFHWGDQRFGDDWPARHRERSGEAGGPGRIPAQLVAHTLFYFTNPGDLVLDPTRPPRLRESNGGQVAGGCVVSDVCLVFERRCQSFDLVTRDNRSEIKYHHWSHHEGHWPSTKKPDLIFFDPPYYAKKEKEYKGMASEKTPSISSYSKGEYEKFFKIFFHLAHQNVKETSRIAFLNADWPPAPLPARRAYRPASGSECLQLGERVRPTPRSARFPINASFKRKPTEFNHHI